MAESEQIPETITEKPKRKYVRHKAEQIPQQPIAPNPNIIALESAIVPLMDQRLIANQKLRSATMRANQANAELEAAREELSQIEGEVNYRLQTIAQLKGVPFAPMNSPAPTYGGAPPRFADYPQQPPSPYFAPVQPYPQAGASFAPMPGVGSMPANNVGLYPDASPRGFVETDPERLANGASAEDVRMFEMKNRGM